MKVPLLDIGNVILKVDFRPFLAWLEDSAAPEFRARVPLVLSSSLFFDFEFGAIGREEYTRRMGELLGASFTLPEMEDRFCAIFGGAVEGMEEMVGKLAAAGPIYALSNTNEIHLEWMRRHFPLIGKFTKLYASHELRMRKPYPGIYRAVADDIGVEPRDLVFFDDVPANVQGALRAGLGAHLFTGAEALAAAMKDLEKSDDKDY